MCARLSTRGVNRRNALLATIISNWLAGSLAIGWRGDRFTFVEPVV
jgi:hypothetical protein